MIATLECIVRLGGYHSGFGPKETRPWQGEMAMLVKSSFAVATAANINQLFGPD